MVKCMMYRFDIPTTKGVSYHKIIRAADILAVDMLSNASIARDDMVAHLIKQEPSQLLLTAIDNYLPYLFGLVVAVEGQPHIRLNDPLCFSWTSSLTNKKAYFTDYTYRYEVVMTLMTYAYVMCNRAWSINETLVDGNFEENSKHAAHYLKSAAGVFDYVHNVELPRWGNLAADRPLDTIAGITAGLSLMCVAATQELVVKKAVLKGTSKSVIVKLSADVWHKYENALAQIQALPDGYSDNVNSTLKSFLITSVNLQKANTYKLAGQVAMEEAKCGIAVANLNIALKALKDVSGSGVLGLWKGVIMEQKADIEHFSRLYNKENDLIAFDKVPEEGMLDKPESKSLMYAILYNPPAPVFHEIK